MPGRRARGFSPSPVLPHPYTPPPQIRPIELQKVLTAALFAVRGGGGWGVELGSIYEFRRTYRKSSGSTWNSHLVPIPAAHDMAPNLAKQNKCLSIFLSIRQSIHMSLCVCIHADTNTDSYTHMETQTDGQTDGQTDTELHRQIHTHAEPQGNSDLARCLVVTRDPPPSCPWASTAPSGP